jgi:threonine synthase
MDDVEIRRGVTPVPAALIRHPRVSGVVVAAEYLLPGGSFKDRGAAKVVAAAKASGARCVALDSSGNAGFAVALYAALEGLRARIHVAAGAAREKLALIQATGADLITHPDRPAAARAASRDDAYDASHIRNPLFWDGVAEAPRSWHAQGCDPEEVWLPVGNGSLLLGLAAGFEARLPRFVGVQPERCAPVARPGSALGTTLADGVAVGEPVHRDRLREIVERSGGRWETVSEDEIQRAFEQAWRAGFPIEPTSALPFALLERARARASSILIVATGSGLKHPPGPRRPAA